MRILYVTQWFEPEPAFKGAGFAEKLAAQGHDVEVATGFPNYPGGRLYPGHRLGLYRSEQTANNIRVHRLFLYPSHDRSAVRRALNYLSFLISCSIFGLLRGWRYDAIYVYHPPITPALAMALVRKLYRFRLVVDIQDLWPDSVAASGMSSPRLVRALEAVCGFVYRHADHLVVQADGMRERLIQRGVPQRKITRIYNWATYASRRAAPVKSPPEFENAMNVVYGGNLGQAQALSFVVEAMRLARAQVPALRLHLFGDGIERDRLRELARIHPDADVILHGSVDRARMDRIFDAADILVLHLKNDPLYDFTIPSKTQHYLASGKPIVAGLRGEAAGILRHSGAAEVCDPEDAAGLAKALVKLGKIGAADRRRIGQSGRDYYERHFSMDAALQQTQAVLTGGPQGGFSPRPPLPVAETRRPS